MKAKNILHSSWSPLLGVMCYYVDTWSGSSPGGLGTMEATFKEHMHTGVLPLERMPAQDYMPQPENQSSVVLYEIPIGNQLLTQPYWAPNFIRP